MLELFSHFVVYNFYKVYVRSCLSRFYVSNGSTLYNIKALKRTNRRTFQRFQMGFLKNHLRGGGSLMASPQKPFMPPFEELGCLVL